MAPKGDIHRKDQDSWFQSKTIADSQEVPTVSARGFIFVPVPLHIEEDDCPPNVVDVKQISSTAVCRSDEVKNFCDKFNVGSSSCVTCVAGASVCSLVFAQGSSSSFVVHQDSQEKEKTTTIIIIDRIPSLGVSEFSEQVILKSDKVEGHVKLDFPLF